MKIVSILRRRIARPVACYPDATFSSGAGQLALPGLSLLLQCLYDFRR
jgi:hypothetical protein